MKIVIILYIIITGSILGVDIITRLVEDYSHFHIGRWEKQEKWLIAVKKICLCWAIHTPTLRIKKECRYILIDKFRGKYGKKMVQSWQKAGCILGLMELQDNEQVKNILNTIKNQLLDEEGNWRIQVNRIDYAMLAYAILVAERNPESIRNSMDQMVKCLEKNLCNDGLISYSAGKQSKRRYVDTLGFVCPFLALYGKVYGKSKYVEMSVMQIVKFQKGGVIRGLPVHCYETETNLPIGVLGWGRGVGWYTLALADLYKEIEENRNKQIIGKFMIEIAERCLIFERKEGGFSTILQAQNVYDSSATAMLGYFYAKCGGYFKNEKYIKIAERCQSRLMKVTKINGVVDECQGDTIDVGIFSQRYAAMPFVQGMTLRLAAALRKSKEV